MFKFENRAANHINKNLILLVVFLINVIEIYWALVEKLLEDSIKSIAKISFLFLLHSMLFEQIICWTTFSATFDNTNTINLIESVKIALEIVLKFVLDQEL
jgi:uncharacterized membrane protein YbhN (UPF0104 family)